jgi:hypothetical protein
MYCTNITKDPRLQFKIAGVQKTLACNLKLLVCNFVNLLSPLLVKLKDALYYHRIKRGLSMEGEIVILKFHEHDLLAFASNSFIPRSADTTVLPLQVAWFCHNQYMICFNKTAFPSGTPLV